MIFQRGRAGDSIRCHKADGHNMPQITYFVEVCSLERAVIGEIAPSMLMSKQITVITLSLFEKSISCAHVTRRLRVGTRCWW